MTQTLTERCEALRSLLPLLTAHLALIPGARIVPRYGDAPTEPGPPAPPWSVLDCDGHCPRCEYDPETAPKSDRCRGEGWERMQCYLDKAYRLDAVRAAYQAMEEARPWMHRAVRLVYVEPADERSECISEPARIMRQRVADDGVEWMAGEIRCDLVAFGETRPPARAETKARNQEIVGLRCQGKSYREIARALGCSKNTVAAVLNGKELRQGRAVALSVAIKVR